MCEIKEALDEWLISSNEVISTMASSMIQNFDKYWGGSTIGMTMAIILDPRFKMKALECYCPIMYGPEASNEVRNIRERCYDLLSEYQFKSPMSEVAPSQSDPSVPRFANSRYKGRNYFAKFDSYVHSTISEGIVK